MKRKLCIAVLGPTASGKTGFAIAVAEKLGGEIVCVDSTTVYRGFDIGTAKPTTEQRQRVPHHLLDILDPQEAFNARDFVDQARAKMEEIASRGKIPVLVGGSYFYLRALQNGMYPTGGYDESVLDALEEEFPENLHEALVKEDPKAAQAIHPNDRYRLLRGMALVRSGQKPSELEPAQPMGKEWLWVKYAMAVSRKSLSDNIALRTKTMVRAGLVDETRSLLAQFPKARTLGSIGYAESVLLLHKKLDESSLETAITENTRKLLKRQMTWLRSDPEVRFVDSRDLGRVELEITNLQSVLA